ncbi:MAG: ATP-binding cassette domain-containing protein [Gemmatimonadota bacterium]
MAALSAQNLTIAFGGRPLLDDAALQVERGERVGLMGRNGEGKSTLLRILAGITLPDEGSVILDAGTRVALLEQEVPPELAGTVEDVVAGGLRGVAPGSRGGAGREALGHEVERLASLLELELDADFAALSGGQQRRAMLGRALAAEPEVLLLDEPTNHLDLDGISWLENFLLRFTGSILFVTHDRVFLQRLATRILELDRGRLTSWACDYPTYLERKEAQLAAEEKAWALEDRKLAQEEAWIRQGIQARRTRNEGRVRALEQLRRDRAARRDRIGSAGLTLQEAERSGKRVVEAKHVSFGYGEETLVRDLSTTILRGDRVGIIGPNGAGKSTLIRLLLGQLPPDSGTIRLGTGLEAAYFDQRREQLDPDRTVAENVSVSDQVMVNGAPRHIMSYLQDFLFPPAQARQPVGSLSGGERNRLLLARLFTRPANLLVLDEPTNDLDAETLELLEARLLDFTGTVLLVSHDRALLDNLCTSTLVFTGNGTVEEHAGGYSEWQRVAERREKEAAEAAAAERARRRKTPSRPAATPTNGKRKRTYGEQLELDKLPARIEELEARLADAHARLAEPDLYQAEADVIRAATEAAATLEGEVEAAYARWAELEGKDS